MRRRTGHVSEQLLGVVKKRENGKRAAPERARKHLCLVPKKQ
jgi:hypothetical protein